ncbi:MAG: hypothetical protein SFW36_12150 [Leptolyngbyaceae cyanobacterium bins.59]|nr:hypothetical protein [Leptolyngbyaceae cyanobacterium bins.59]
MKILLLIPFAIYVLLAPRFFAQWQWLFQQDTNLSAEDQQTSKIMVILATLCWPIVVPFAYLELLNKVRQNRVVLAKQPVEKSNLNGSHEIGNNPLPEKPNRFTSIH